SSRSLVAPSFVICFFSFPTPTPPRPTLFPYTTLVRSAPAAVAMVWRWMYNSEYGLINTFLKFLGFSGNIEWLYNPNVVLWSLIIVGIWSSVGYNMILLLSGLQEIPTTYYEAADL